MVIMVVIRDILTTPLRVRLDLGLELGLELGFDLVLRARVTVLRARVKVRMVIMVVIREKGFELWLVLE
jgi:hypothetical protein